MFENGVKKIFGSKNFSLFLTSEMWYPPSGEKKVYNNSLGKLIIMTFQLFTSVIHIINCFKQNLTFFLKSFHLKKHLPLNNHLLSPFYSAIR